MVRSREGHPGPRWPSRSVARIRSWTCWNGRRGRQPGHRARDPTLLTFVAQLGAALSEMGEPVSSVQDRLTAVARAYGATEARVERVPDLLHDLDGHRGARGARAHRPPSVARSASTSSPPSTASSAMPPAARSTRRTDWRGSAAIRTSAPRFTTLVRVLGYCVLTVGLTLILHPAPSDVAGRRDASDSSSARCASSRRADRTCGCCSRCSPPSSSRHSPRSPSATTSSTRRCAPSSPRSSCSYRARR